MCTPVLLLFFLALQGWMHLTNGIDECNAKLDGYSCVCSQRIGNTNIGGWIVDCAYFNGTIAYSVDISINTRAVATCQVPAAPFQKAMYKDFMLGNIQKFEFNYCPMPNITFAEVLEGMNVTSLKVDNSVSQKSLNASVFGGLRNLTTLLLKRNGIEDLPDGLLEEFPNLKTLEIIEDKIHMIRRETFRSPHNITNLWLGSNKISEIEPKAFANLTHLKYLSLMKNRINRLTNETFVGLQSLEILDLTGNQLMTFPEDVFFELANLTVLHLKFNKLVSLPEKLFRQTTKLKVLDISQNPDIRELPENLLQGLHSLQNISLQDCNITSMPEKFFQSNEKLLAVFARNNRLTSLPSNVFANNPELRVLNFNYNDLKTLPSDIFSKQFKLEELSLHKNNLEDLPPNVFSNLVKLDKLILSSNFLTNVHKDAFTKNQQLRHLDLSGNRIEMLNGLTPFGLGAELEHVDFSRNKLKSMPVINWAIYLQLKTLNLDFNQLTSFLVPLLYAPHVKVFLRNNNITAIDVSVINTVATIRRVNKLENYEDVPIFYFANNPLHCDCHLYDFIRLANAYRYVEGSIVGFDSTGLQCAEPANLVGMSPLDVDKSKLICNITDGCENPCECYFRQYDGKTIVNCSNKGMTNLPTSIPLHTNILHFEGNFLTTLNKISDPIWVNLTELYADGNEIQQEETWQLPPKLQRLSLSYNKLQGIPKSIMDYTNSSENFRVLIGGNPIQCDCSAVPLKAWLSENAKKVSDINNVYCQNRRYENGTKSPILVVRMPDDILCPIDDSAQRLQLAIVASLCAALAVMLFIVSVLYYRNKQTVIAYMYIHLHNVFVCLFSEEDIDEEKVFDAFVSYSNSDRDVAFALLNELENSNPPFKLCIHERDWVPGNMISWNIVNSVQNSRRTILILSKDFLKSVWFQVEFHTAYYQMLEDKIDRLIVIVNGELPPKESMDKDLHFLLTTKTYLVWGERWFWEKLRYALPHKKLSAPIDNKMNLTSRPNGAVFKAIDEQITNYALSTAPTVTTQIEEDNGKRSIQKQPLDRCNSTTESTAQLVLNDVNMSTACL